MRPWNLGPGDPLVLSLSADARLGETDYWDDQTWELEIGGGGEPAALAFSTTFGLRARALRLFPRFLLGGDVLCAPLDFAEPPRLCAFYPNFLEVRFAPVPSLGVEVEYWKPGPRVVAGRWCLVNRSMVPLKLTFEQCAFLLPLEGQAMRPTRLQLTHVLAGAAGGLAIVLFLTGGPQAGTGPYPALALDLVLEPNTPHTFTWALATAEEREAAFEQARRTVACPWEAERVRLELLNASQTVEIQTGDPDWDAALALSQKEAFRLLLGATSALPFPSFVLARRSEYGLARRSDGSDHPSLWSGQTPLEAYYLASLLPGAPEIAQGLLANFLATWREDGFVDCRPGLAGQRGRCLAAPLLASLAWQGYWPHQDRRFLESVFHKLVAFYRLWFSPEHDRDGDGFPEWEHPLQVGPENVPAEGLGWRKIATAIEDPRLGAMLYREGQLLARMAEILNCSVEKQEIATLVDTIRSGVEACWQANPPGYRQRDFASHHSPRGVRLHQQRGNGVLEVKKPLERIARLLIRVRWRGTATRRPEVVVHGWEGKRRRREVLQREDFDWRPTEAIAVTRGLFTALEEVRVDGLAKQDVWSIAVMDCAGEDYTLLLPLWAEIPEAERAGALINRWLRLDEVLLSFPATHRSGNSKKDLAEAMKAYGYYLPWLQLIGEGLLAYGRREEATRLLERIMAAVVWNLKHRHSFFQTYHAETGAGLGERGHLGGLAPVGLFLDVLGVRFSGPRRVILSGKNPFPWPVVVQYRGTQVTRRLDETVIQFVNGQRVTVPDPSETIVSVD